MSRSNSKQGKRKEHNQPDNSSGLSDNGGDFSYISRLVLLITGLHGLGIQEAQTTVPSDVPSDVPLQSYRQLLNGTRVLIPDIMGNIPNLRDCPVFNSPVAACYLQRGRGKQSENLSVMGVNCQPH